MELFRVAPLKAYEVLIGKYLGFMMLGIVLTALLTLILTVVLGVPMIGSWFHYALVVAVLLMTSLGIGFVISSLSQTTSQAVLFTMIVLLTSVFFSGFMINLHMIWQPVQIISWALPTTYGIVMLRDIFFRGSPADMVLLGRLAAIGFGLSILAWFLLHRITARKK